MALVVCKEILENHVTNSTILVNFCFESSCVESFRPYIDENSNIIEDETVIYFKSGSIHTVNMSFNDVFHYTNAVPYSMN